MRRTATVCCPRVNHFSRFPLIESCTVQRYLPEASYFQSNLQYLSASGPHRFTLLQQPNIYPSGPEPLAFHLLFASNSTLGTDSGLPL